MDNDDRNRDAQRQPSRWKGKGRATAGDASETTPLLGATSDNLIQDDTPAAEAGNRRRLYLLLSTVFFTTLCACIISLLVLVFIACSYSSKVSNVAPGRLLDSAVVLEGPQRIDILNATEGVIWLRVEGSVGVDADAALDTILEGGGGGLQRWVGRWAIRQVRSVTVKPNVVVLTDSVSHTRLCSVLLPPIQLPLTISHPKDSSWLTNMSIAIRITLASNSTDLENFVRTSWMSGFADVDTGMSKISIHVGSGEGSFWSRTLRATRRNVSYPIHYKLPDLHGLPNPGKNSSLPDLADLVTLDKIHVNTRHHDIAIVANATAMNPLPESFHMNIPALPFTVFLPNSNESNFDKFPALIPIVAGETLPFKLTHPNLTLDLSASILQINHDSMAVISSFVSTFLSGNSAPFVAGTPFLPSLRIPMKFPALNPKPQVLRDVAIRNMHISLNGEVVLASGTVYARVVLPLDIRLKMDVERIWPDVLVYDGEVTDETFESSRFNASNEELRFSESSRKYKGGDIPRPPLPDPLPENAFARIRPGDWLLADSVALPIPDEDGSMDDGTSEYMVTADIENVPLEVLPGRQKLMSSFVAKVLFGPKGALAGVQGTAAVAASVDGLPYNEDGREGSDGTIELLGLPFTGSFRVGKKAL